MDYDFSESCKKMETTVGLFGALEVAQRQYDLACEVKDYLKEHPTVAVVNLYEIMQFASCHLREVVYNNGLLRLTTLRVSSRCPVMIEDRKRWGFERLSIRTGNSRQVGRFDTLGEPICPGRTCTRSRTAGKSVGNTGKCCQTGKAEVRTKTEICQSIIRYQT